jgi:uncharacterized protein (DUF302 family)
MKPIPESIAYGRVVHTDLPFETALRRIKEALKAEGFGILCDIDVEATMREKLGIDFRPYRILGACNPPLAYRALSAEPQLGLLLPCNVVVQEVDGRAVISAIDAPKMMGMIGNDALHEIADDANARLDRVLGSFSKEAQ